MPRAGWELRMQGLPSPLLELSPKLPQGKSSLFRLPRLLISSTWHFQPPETSGGWSFVCVAPQRHWACLWEEQTKSSLEKNGNWQEKTGLWSCRVGRKSGSPVHSTAERGCWLRGRFGINQGFLPLEGHIFENLMTTLPLSPGTCM